MPLKTTLLPIAFLLAGAPVSVRAEGTNVVASQKSFVRGGKGLGYPGPLLLAAVSAPLTLRILAGGANLRSGS